MGPTGWCRTCAALMIGLVALVACQPGSSSRAALSSPSPFVTPEASRTVLETKIVERVIDFDDKGVRGTDVHRIDYGRETATVGFARRCAHDGCRYPCPCTLPVVPESFDIDPKGRLWILDPVADRIAVFNEDSTHAFDVSLRGISHPAFDLQVVGDSVVTTFQGDNVNTVVLEIDLNGNLVSKRFVARDGERISADDIDVVQDRLFSSAFVGPVITEREQFVEIALTADGPARASDSDGWPAGDGLLLVTNSSEELTIPLVLPDAGLSQKLTFVLRQRIANRVKTKNGTISWGNMEVADDGAIHFIIAAGTYGKEPEDGLWYLKVGSDGTVGAPIRLRDAERDNHGQAPRVLTLDHDGRPFAMWTDGDALVIESLAPVETKSLPE